MSMKKKEIKKLKKKVGYSPSMYNCPQHKQSMEERFDEKFKEKYAKKEINIAYQEIVKNPPNIIVIAKTVNQKELKAFVASEITQAQKELSERVKLEIEEIKGEIKDETWGIGHDTTPHGEGLRVGAEEIRDIAIKRLNALKKSILKEK